MTRRPRLIRQGFNQTFVTITEGGVPVLDMGSIAPEAIWAAAGTAVNALRSGCPKVQMISHEADIDPEIITAFKELQLENEAFIIGEIRGKRVFIVERRIDDPNAENDLHAPHPFSTGAPHCSEGSGVPGEDK